MKLIETKTLAVSIMTCFTLISIISGMPHAYAGNTSKPSRAPASAFGSTASAAPREVDKPLKVNGQSRNINMMMTLKNESDQIGFVAPRKDFKDKVPTTHF